MMSKDNFLNLLQVKSNLSPEMMLFMCVTVLGSHVENVDLSKVLNMNAIVHAFESVAMAKDYKTFSDNSDRVGEMMNSVNSPELWSLWLEYHLSENSKEVKFLKGCRKLVQIVQDNLKFRTSWPKILNKLDDYCNSSNLMQEIFGG